MKKTFYMTTLAASLLLAACGTETSDTDKTSGSATPPTEEVENVTPPTEEMEEQNVAKFTQKQAVIQSIEQLDDATQLHFEDDNGEPYTFWLSADTPIIDNVGNDVTLEEGMTVSGYFYTNGPMVMIYPPRYTAAMIVVQTEKMGNVDVAAYNDELINDTNSLKLTIDDTVQLVGTEEVVAGDYAVFYDMSTRSIPAQTTPKKIIAIVDPYADDTVSQ